jgi:archaellum component FlaC
LESELIVRINGWHYWKDLLMSDNNSEVLKASERFEELVKKYRKDNARSIPNPTSWIIDGLEAHANLVKATSMQLHKDLVTLNLSVQTMKQGISDLDKSLGNIDTRTGNLNESLSMIDTSVGNLNTSIGSVSSGITKLDPSIGNVKTEVTNLNSSIKTVKDEVGKLTTSSKTLELLTLTVIFASVINVLVVLLTNAKLYTTFGILYAALIVVFLIVIGFSIPISPKKSTPISEEPS